SFTFYHSNSLLTSVDCYTLLKSKFFATVPQNTYRGSDAYVATEPSLARSASIISLNQIATEPL
ncbi:hypothetical protein, partial [Piscirickettsia salmonis]|uniref:hypothetical protein n=1 Tax=Piscirickettsia salmonis TaxID=1238 RepID=UPI001C54C9D6